MGLILKDICKPIVLAMDVLRESLLNFKEIRKSGTHSDQLEAFSKLDEMYHTWKQQTQSIHSFDESQLIKWFNAEKKAFYRYKKKHSLRSRDVEALSYMERPPEEPTPPAAAPSQTQITDAILEEVMRGQIQEDQARQRHEGITEVCQDVVTVHGMFQQIAGRVQSQGEDLGRIRANVHTGRQAVDHSVDELAATQVHVQRRSNRSWKVMGVVLLAILAAVFLSMSVLRKVVIYQPLSVDRIYARRFRVLARPQPLVQGPPTGALARLLAGAPTPYVIFYRPDCGFCHRAHHLLRAHQLEAHWINLHDHPLDLHQALLAHTGRTSVPSIWLDSQFVGGFDQLHAALGQPTSV